MTCKEYKVQRKKMPSIHWKMCQYSCALNAEKLYEHHIESVMQGNENHFSLVLYHSY